MICEVYAQHVKTSPLVSNVMARPLQVVTIDKICLQKATHCKDYECTVTLECPDSVTVKHGRNICTPVSQ
jgi:hypothetical protein